MLRQLYHTHPKRKGYWPLQWIDPYTLKCSILIAAFEVHISYYVGWHHIMVDKFFVSVKC